MDCYNNHTMLFCGCCEGHVLLFLSNIFELYAEVYTYITSSQLLLSTLSSDYAAKYKISARILS